MRPQRKIDTSPGSTVFVTRPRGDWPRGVGSLFSSSGLDGAVRRVKRIVIKPNLVEAKEPPITTPVGLVEAIVDYLRVAAPDAELIVADGCGSLDYDTHHCFSELGYDALLEKGMRLVDLNKEELVKLSNPDFKRFPEIYLPRIVMDSFLLSVPVLKAHSLSRVTLTMKNMVGVLPPSHYQQGGHWKKSYMHTDVDRALFELNSYRAPDFTVLDATVGMSEAHLWGPVCDPPPGILAAGFDPVAIDAYGTGLLNKDVASIEHIMLADGVLGSVSDMDVFEI